MTETTTGAYRAAYDASLDDPATFWLAQAGDIDWVSPPREALDASRAPLYRWFPDARMNTCENALDRHVAAGRGEQTALIYDSAMLGVCERISYAELLERVSVFAGALAARGVGVGDRVVIYLPMIPEAVIAMLACARLGAVHSVVFGGFAANELAARIDDARPTALITASGGLEPGRPVEYVPIVREALALATHQVESVIVRQRPEVSRELPPDWIEWDTAIAGVAPHPPVPVAATDPLYILYTSGTTGSPKGVVRDNGGHAVALTWSLRNIYGIGPGDVMFTASDVGWVVGHSYIVYAPLLLGATTVLYEGKPVGTPHAGAFWRVVEEHQVNVLFTAPTAIRAIRKADPDGRFAAGADLSSLRALFLAGERLDPPTWDWARSVLGRPVVDHWWQTETGWAICANPFGLEPLDFRPGSPSVPMPGYAVDILDGDGHPVAAGEEGNIVIRLPLPPGTLSTLWNRDEAFVNGYLSAFPGYYLTGDSGHLDEDGYLSVMGRTDDIINVAGHRLSTGAIEQVLAQHPAVAECAVIGERDEVKGERPLGFVVLKTGATIDEDSLAAELTALVREQVGPVASFAGARVVSALPKTRSGKVLRKTIRQIVNGEKVTVPPTIEDPAALDPFSGFRRV